MSSLIDQLKSLRSTIVDRPPYRSGTLRLPQDGYTLFYGKGRDARRIDLASASKEDLKHLAETCDIATFGVNKQDVHDESYRKAGKLFSAHFALKFDPAGAGLLETISMDFLEGHRERKSIDAELYKLNVYGKDSFFKAHKDTPRSETMFGSLVIVFPTHHEGGALLLRHGDGDWTFDSAKLLAEQQMPCIAYVAFYSDVEHEVTTVTSGYRITVTYNLYFSESPSPSSTSIICPDTNEAALKVTFQRLLDEPSFLPAGGHLGFGLHHQYPLDVSEIGWEMDEKKQALHSLSKYLKGSDAILMKVCQDLSLAASIRMVIVENRCDESNEPVYVMCEHAVNLENYMVDSSLWDHLREYEKGQLLTPIPSKNIKPDMDVHWVTETPKANHFKSRYIAYGNDASMAYEYAHLCLLVDVGPVGGRIIGQEVDKDDGIASESE